MSGPGILGIDIGGTKIAAALVRPDGSIAAAQHVPTPAAEGARAVLEATLAAGRSVLDTAAAQGVEVLAAGVGAAGHVDHGRGVIMYAAGTLPGWAGTELRGALQAAFGLPVAVDNDVNAMALGEARFGAGRSFSHALYLTVGTGIGGAVVHGGELWRGHSWTAGEIGHLVIDWNGERRCSCGASGHLEAYAAGPAIAARYAALAGLDLPLDLYAVAQRAEAGDAIARQAISEGAQILGLALGGLLNVLDPQALVIGGGVTQLGGRWWQPLEAALRANPMPGPARIVLRHAQLGMEAVLIGAAWLALREHASYLLDQGATDAHRPDTARRAAG